MVSLGGCTYPVGRLIFDVYVPAEMNGPQGQAVDSPRHLPIKSGVPKQANAAHSKEFDPLSAQRSVDETQSKVMSSFGITNDGKSPSVSHTSLFCIVYP